MGTWAVDTLESMEIIMIVMTQRNNTVRVGNMVHLMGKWGLEG